MPASDIRKLLGKTLEDRYRLNLKEPKKAPLSFIGFDGFTDEIVKVVSSRKNFEEYLPYQAITPFAEKIREAAGKSCNLELVVQLKKLGGNAPIMTNALLEGGSRVIFAGPIGVKGKIEPSFKHMAERCEKVIPLGPSAHSDALEFNDGKIIFGKMESLREVNYANLVKYFPLKNLISTLNKASLFVSANWTMLPTMNELWEKIYNDVVPHLKARRSSNPRWMFVDLADPAKRSDADLQEALRLLQQLGTKFRVILGLNFAEGARIGSVLKKTCSQETPDAVAELAQGICRSSGLDHVVIHATKFATAANKEKTWKVEGPYTPSPEFSTGAGDNFNAGFCNALLCGCSMEECLFSGVYTSGFYVRKGHSPSISELVKFLA